MNHQLQLLDANVPVQPIAALPARVREHQAEPAPLTSACELWAAVQLGDQDAAGSTADVTLLATLVKRAQDFTPRVVVESNDAVLLELAGSQRLFGGMPALLAALRKAFPRPLQLAMAPTPLAAVLLARAGRNCCITSMGRLTGRLAALPVGHLHWPEEELQRLRSMGIATVGELLRLPRAGLARRIGPERLWQLDRLTGLRPDPRASIPLVENFSERIDPDHETTDREQLLRALMHALKRLEDFLRERQRGIMVLRLTLHYRHAGPQSCMLRCVVPEYRIARFAALLEARLESLSLSAPVRHMQLTAGRLRRFAAVPGELWRPGEHGGSAAAAEAPEFLQTLMARLGDHAVQGLKLIDEHRPERQCRNTWPLRDAAALHAGRQNLVRPLGLLATPQPLEMVCDAAGQVRQLLHEGLDLHCARSRWRTLVDLPRMRCAAALVCAWLLCLITPSFTH
jgi:protein ImuB